MYKRQHEEEAPRRGRAAPPRPAQANIIFGALVQDGMADELSITVLATGIAASALERAVSGGVDVRPLLPQAGRPGRRRAGLPAFLRRK